MSKPQVYLIDATAFCYRAFYALKDLRTSSGQPTNAVYGFVNILNKILKEKQPYYCAVCFDVSRKTHRQEKFAEYKSHRPPTPEGLSSQFPFIKELVRAYGIALFEREGYEADDIIATLAARSKESGFETVIVSNDKDLLQLVDEKTVVLSPHKDADIIYTREKVRERFGVGPESVTDIIALMGDDTDNIPGVPGVGEKTAVELIRSFGSAAGVLGHLDAIKQERLRSALAEHSEQIRMCRELAALNKDVDLPSGLDQLKIGEPDNTRLIALFQQLEFKKMLKDLVVAENAPEQTAVISMSDGQFCEWVKNADELYIWGSDLPELIYSRGDGCVQVAQPAEAVRRVLADPQIRKIGHDLKKMKVSLSRQSVSLQGLYFDTMIAAYLLNPSRGGYTFDEVSWHCLGTAMDMEKASSAQCLAGLIRLRRKLEDELARESLGTLFHTIEMPLADVLAAMELKGIALDEAALLQLSKEIEARLVVLIEQIYAQSGTQFNINSTKQLREVLFTHLKLPVIKKGKTGPSTDEEVLRVLASRHPLPALLLDYRQLTKLKNTYVDTLPQLVDAKTGRLHTQFNQTGTETGRLSSSNPNLQNIPVKTDIGRLIRKAIVAEGSDACFLACDYSQIELRVLAHLSGDENLIQAFKENKDIHRATAALIRGIEESDVDDGMRETAKRVNFGIVYGLTGFGLSRDLGISVDEANGFIDAYFLRYPRVREYILGQIERARKDGFVTTILGRRRYIPEINNKNQGIRQFAERQAVNTPIQGSASDLIKMAMIALQREIETQKLPASMILQIHDELIFELREGDVSEAAVVIKDKMEHVLPLAVAIRVDIKKGKNWIEMEAL